MGRNSAEDVQRNTKRSVSQYYKIPPARSVKEDGICLLDSAMGDGCYQVLYYWEGRGEIQDVQMNTCI